MLGQRGLRDQRPGSQLGLSRPQHIACTHSPWHIQSLPHAHLHAKLPALAGEPGPPSTLPLLCRVVGERARRAWGCPGGGWAGAGAEVGGKWALGTKGSHPRSGPESSGKGGKGFSSHSPSPLPQPSLNEGV